VIRLANNNLVDTRGLFKVNHPVKGSNVSKLSQLALDLVEAPEEIAWLDLSFNHIEEVTDDILE
jgi:hypothetical protein